jgi:hypothetical protein
MAANTRESGSTPSYKISGQTVRPVRRRVAKINGWLSGRGIIMIIIRKD